MLVPRALDYNFLRYDGGQVVSFERPGVWHDSDQFAVAVCGKSAPKIVSAFSVSLNRFSEY